MSQGPFHDDDMPPPPADRGAGYVIGNIALILLIGLTTLPLIAIAACLALIAS